MKKAFRTNWTQNEIPFNDDEKFTLPSRTVPDDAMSIPEILTRYAKGYPIGGGRNAIWNGEEDPLDGVNPATLDLVDIQNMGEDLAYQVKQLKKPPVEPTAPIPDPHLMKGDTKPEA